MFADNMGHFSGFVSVFLLCSLGIWLQAGLTRAAVCTECAWDPWKPWSQCSKTCGEGTRTRTRGLCCEENLDFNQCIQRCNISDTSFEYETCGYVCPAGNCTFQNVENTGIAATDYQELHGTNPGMVINPPIHLISDLAFCKKSCLQANLQNGLFCWSYTYSAQEKCYLHFYKNPLTIVHPELQGQSVGESIFIRSCTERVACTATQADIVFVVDSSGSIGTENFDKIKIFLQGLVNGLDIDPDLTRVGLMLFNDVSTWQFKLDTYSDKFSTLKAIQRLLYVVGGTMTSDALEKVRLEGFAGNRTGVPMIAVVITDGLSRLPSLTRFQASLLRREGVQVYAIGVGNNTNDEEIYNIASVPEERYMYNFSTFDDLDASLVKFDTNYVNCKVKVTTTTQATTVVENHCKDKISNCANYGKDACTDYAPWAHANCPLFCGFCKGPSTTPEPCVDRLPNCDTYGQFYCQNKEYVGWVAKNCRRYCGICKGEEVTTVPTTLATTAPQICQDTVSNCESYINSCDDPEFKGFLEARCPASCGYCQSHKTVNGTMVNDKRCPDWFIPVECEMVQSDELCCPFPQCPNEYIFTADMGRS